MRLLSNVIKSPQTHEAYSRRKTIQLANKVLEKREDYGVAGSDPLKRVEIEAENIRKKAEADAGRMVREIEGDREKAKKEMEQSLEAAKRQGQQQGYQHGLNEGRKQYEERIGEAQATVVSAKEGRRDRLDETEYDILALAVKIAGEIIGTTLIEDETRWLDVVKDAITEVKEYEEIRLIVHHKWYDFVVSHRKELEVLLKKTAELYIYPEAVNDELSCIIEFPYGRIDAGIDSQLSEIKQKLAAKLEESEDERANLAFGN